MECGEDCYLVNLNDAKYFNNIVCMFQISEDFKEDYSDLPPSQRVKKLTQKIQCLQKELETKSLARSVGELIAERARWRARGSPTQVPPLAPVSQSIPVSQRIPVAQSIPVSQSETSSCEKTGLLRKSCSSKSG